MTDDEIRAFLDEDDDFRLAVRGFAEIEKMIDDAIADALPGRWRGKVRSFGGFESRLTLAVALAIVPQDWMPSIRSLARLRNDFAHGKIEHLTRSRARQLAQALHPIIEDAASHRRELEKHPPTMTLKDVTFAIYVGVRLMIAQHIEWRYETGVAAIVAGDLPKKIMEKWRAQGSPGAPWAKPSS